MLLLVVASVLLRGGAALGHPAFPAQELARVRSDPALIYYTVERIVEAGGGVWSDARADRRIEYPEGVDAFADFTIAQEFPVAWVHLALGGRLPLSESALWTMAFFASLGAVAAWLLARELTGSSAAGLVAALLWTLTPANYRTIGFVLVREDFSFPFFALHLALLARAARLGRARTHALAGLSLGLSLASWHAASFLLLLELAVFALWFVATGRKPRGAHGAWAGAAVVACFGLAVPALRAKGFLVSAPALLAWLLALLFHVPAAWRRTRARRAGALAAGVALLGIGVAGVASVFEGAADYGHVGQLLLAKLLLFGQKPPQPETLGFDVRLMWQSSFETLRLPWSRWARWGPALVIFAWAAHRAWPDWTSPVRTSPIGTSGEVARGAAAASASTWRSDGRALVFALGVLSLPSAWLLQRLVILPGFLGPVVASTLFAGSPHRRLLRVLATAFQAAVLAAFLRGLQLGWHQPPAHRAELAAALECVTAEVPAGDAVASDFVTSTAILAHTRRPILFQPKYESRASRARIEQFTEAFFHGSPAALRALLLDRFQCRWLLVDREMLGREMLYLAGIADTLGGGVRAGTAAALLLGRAGDPRAEGFEPVGPSGSRSFVLFRLGS